MIMPCITHLIFTVFKGGSTSFISKGGHEILHPVMSHTRFIIGKHMCDNVSLNSVHKVTKKDMTVNRLNTHIRNPQNISVH